MLASFEETQVAVAMVWTVLDVTVPLPLQLTEKVRLERASDLHIQHYNFRASNTLLPLYENIYEVERVCLGKNSFKVEPLPRDKWRYYALVAEGNNGPLHEVLAALNICSTAIHSYTCFIFYTNSIGEEEVAYLAGPGRTEQVFVPPIPQTFDAESAEDAIECIKCYRALNNERHEGIRRAIQLMQHIHSSNLSDHFQVLALFSVIEMLITHKPGDKEIGDSLMHQIKTKIPLLSARMPKPISYPGMQHAEEEKIWDRLYAYRSAVAHGDHVKFDGRQQILVSSHVARDVLLEATRLILRQAMREPDLVTMLKAV